MSLSARVRLSEASEQALGVLRRGMRRAHGFALFVVLASDFARAEVLRRLVAWSGQDGVPSLRFFPSGPEAAQAVESFLIAADKAHPWSGAVIPYAEVLLDEDGGQTARSLNMARDVLGRLIKGPLVLVLPEKRMEEFWAAAEDFWEVRSGTFAVEGEAEWDTEPEAEAEPEAEPDAVAIAAAESEAVRLRELEASGEVFAGALSDAWNKLAGRLYQANAWPQAMDAAKEAERLARSVGYPPGIANALLTQGQILERTGPADTWVGVAREALLHYTAMGLPIGIALGYFHLARALSEVGELDEARRCLQWLVDHRPSSLGEADARGVVFDLIAEVSQRCGGIDEALRMRRQEVLPFIERQDDSSLLLRGRVRLAKDLLLRSAPGDRDEAANLLRLAHEGALRLGLPKEADAIRKLQEEEGLALEPPSP